MHTTPRGGGRGRPRIAHTVALALLIPQLIGCYHHVPVDRSAAGVGSRVSIGLTDRGRVAVAPLLGPGVRRVDGALLSSEDSSIVLAVSSVEYTESAGPWALPGERLEVSPLFITHMTERRMSKSRSWMMAGVIAVGAVIVSTIGIQGFGADRGSDKPGGGDPSHQ